MEDSIQNARMLSFSVPEMLREWKLRKGFVDGRRDCSVERDDGIDLDALLKRQIDAWYERLLAEAPTEWLPVSDIAADCQTEASERGVTVYLPEDCVRVVEVKMPDWHRSVCHIERDGSEIARRQASEWLRAGRERPVAIAGHRCLYLFPSSGGDAVLPDKLLAVCRPPQGNYRFSEAALHSISVET